MLYQPESVYSKFDIKCINIDQIDKSIFNMKRKEVKSEYMLDIDKAISLITSYNHDKSGYFRQI